MPAYRVLYGPRVLRRQRVFQNRGEARKFAKLVGGRMSVVTGKREQK